MNSLRADASSSRPSRWNLEGEVQAHSVAGPGSPWFGIGAGFRLSDTFLLGLRGYVPAAKTVDKSSYAVEAYLRIRLTETAHTQLFLEPSYAQDFYRFLPFNSYGMALGALGRVAPGLSVGVKGGIEAAQVVLDSIGLERRSDTVIYPKVALFANFGL